MLLHEEGFSESYGKIYQYSAKYNLDAHGRRRPRARWHGYNGALVRCGEMLLDLGLF